MSQLSDVLDDLSSRFVLNLPPEERQDPIRICFSLEQAHWYYLDFYRKQNPSLPNLSLQNFLGKAFLHVPVLRHLAPRTAEIYQEWRAYKISVPVFGAILLNANCDKVVLVKSWGSKGSWGFPKGKVNQNESELDCAIREVFEETSYDFTPLSNNNNFLTITHQEQDQKLFIVVGVPETTEFSPRTRNEISKIDWHEICKLPTKKSDSDAKAFFMVAPFVGKLRKWLASQVGQAVRKAALKAQKRQLAEQEVQKQNFLQQSPALAKLFAQPTLVPERNPREPETQQPLPVGHGAPTSSQPPVNGAVGQPPAPGEGFPGLPRFPGFPGVSLPGFGGRQPPAQSKHHPLPEGAPQPPPFLAPPGQPQHPPMGHPAAASLDLSGPHPWLTFRIDGAAIMQQIRGTLG